MLTRPSGEAAGSHVTSSVQPPSSGQGLSRQPTEPVIDASLPSSSSSSLSLSMSSFSSTNSDTGDTGDVGDQKLVHILAAVQEMVDQCRICWVCRETTRPHRTFRCGTGICSNHDWDKFKVNLRFPKGAVCYFCLCLYGPPFNHERASPGSRSSADLCEYPDMLKELVFILYQDKAHRSKIFTKLGTAGPSTLSLYQRFIGKRQSDGIFGAYKVVNAYLKLRESGGLES